MLLKGPEGSQSGPGRSGRRRQSLGRGKRSGIGQGKMPGAWKRICELERHRRDDDAVTRWDVSGAAMRAHANAERFQAKRLCNLGGLE